MSVALVPKGNFVRSARRPAEAAISPISLLAAVMVAGAYFVGAEVGFGFNIGGIPTSLFWLPNATMFAVFLLVPPRRWWLYAMITFPAHLAVQLRHDMPLPALLMLFATNLGDGLLGAVAVRQLTDYRKQRFDGFRSVLVFLLAAIIAPMIVSFFDAAVMVTANVANDYWLVWQTRFRSNSLTNILLVPAVVLTITRMRSWLRDIPPRRYLEAALLLGALVVTAKFVFGTPSTSAGMATALVYAPLPLLLWAALRFGTAGVSLSLLTVGTLVIWDAMNQHGPFAGYPREAEILTLQVFLTLLSIPSLLLSGLIEERRRAELALRESEAQYRSIFESTGDGVLITDLAHTVAAANPAFYRITGYDEGKLRNTHPRGFFHLDDLQPFDSYLARASTSSDSVTTQALCVREDGGLSRFEIHGRRFSYGGLPHVLSVVRDVTERERAFQELEQRVAERTRALSTVLEISKTVASTLELAPLLGIVLDQLQTIVKYTGATVLIQREDGDLVILDHRGPLTAEQVAHARITAEEAANCPTLQRGSPLVVDDIRSDSPSAKAYREAMPRSVIELFGYARSVMNVPLRARDRVIGVLRIDNSEPNQYTVHDAELAWALASQSAVAIENARLYDQARGLAAFEERQRLARDLHDSVTQTLCAVAMLGKILPETWQRDPAEGRKSLANLDEMTQSALAEMRTLLLELRPDTLVEAGLGELLRQLADAFRSRVRAPIQVDVEEGARLPPEVHVTFYRVAQEALANSSRHASAATVRMSLFCTETDAKLSIRDDGIGFEASEVLPGHLGILIMRERMNAIGATMDIHSATGKGTTVIARWNAPQDAATGAPASASRPSNPTHA